MDSEVALGSVVVLARDPMTRDMIAALVRDEGDDPVLVERPEDTLHPDILDRARLLVIESVVWDDAILDVLAALAKRPIHPRVALVFSVRTASLRLHPAVGYSLFTPCAAPKLREFVRAVTSAGFERRSRPSGVRWKASETADEPAIDESGIRIAGVTARRAQSGR